jgi:hypothetical protein
MVDRGKEELEASSRVRRERSKHNELRLQSRKALPRPEKPSRSRHLRICKAWKHNMPYRLSRGKVSKCSFRGYFLIKQFSIEGYVFHARCSRGYSCVNSCGIIKRRISTLLL